MSVDYFVYSPSAPPSRSAVNAALQAAGWSMSHELDADGPVATGAVCAGPHAACELIVTHPFNPEEEFGEDWQDQRCPKAARAIRAAKTLLVISTSSNRTDASARLQLDLWNGLANLATGLMEDPQSGELVIVAKRGRTAIDDEEPGAHPVIQAFLDAAWVAGFPVERTDPWGFATYLRLEDLPPCLVESLLRFTRVHFGADSGGGASMALNILRQYAMCRTVDDGWRRDLEARYVTV